MRAVIGGTLLAVGALGALWLMTLPVGYAPWGIVVAPTACAAIVAGARMVRE